MNKELRLVPLTVRAVPVGMIVLHLSQIRALMSLYSPIQRNILCLLSSAHIIYPYEIYKHLNRLYSEIQ